MIPEQEQEKHKMNLEHLVPGSNKGIFKGCGCAKKTELSTNQIQDDLRTKVKFKRIITNKTH